MELAPNPVAQKTSRVEWIDFAKAVSISLVTIIHFTPFWAPKYWLFLRDVIHDFRVPSLIVISGMFFRDIALSSYLRKRLSRLLVPFFVVGTVLFLLKFLSQQFVPVDKPVTLENLCLLFVNPINSYAPILWFLPALYVLGLVVVVMRKIMDYRLAFLVLFVCVVYVPWTGTLFDQIRMYAPYFAAGPIVLSIMSRPVRITVAVVGLVSCAVVYLGLQYINGPLKWGGLTYLGMVQSLAGVVAVLLVGRILEYFVQSAWLRKTFILISSSSMAIYLFHTVFESSARIVATITGVYKIVPFPVIAAIVCGLGVLGPVLLDRMVIQRNYWARRAILGEH